MLVAQGIGSQGSVPPPSSEREAMLFGQAFWGFLSLLIGEGLLFYSSLANYQAAGSQSGKIFKHRTENTPILQVNFLEAPVCCFSQPLGRETALELGGSDGRSGLVMSCT